MKTLILNILLLPLYIFSQEGISFYSDYRLPVYNEFILGVKDFKQSGSKISINNFGIGCNAQIYRDKHFAIKLGLNYKYLDLILRDEIKSVNYYKVIAGSHGSHTDQLETYYFQKDMPDFHNQSHSLGVNFDFKYIFYENQRNNHGIGLLSTLYFIESYKGFYQSTELSELRRIHRDDSYLTFGYRSRLLLNEKYSLSRNILVSAVDLQLYYQYTLNFSEKFSLGFRASIGTNLYSDWNQFKKYVWVGFGVNFGFLSNEKVRVNKKMPLGEVEKKESM